MRLEWRRCRGSTVGSVSKGESVKESSRCKSKISSKDERYQKLLYLRSVRANVQGKAVTREATREAKLKRGGMKERSKIEIFITKVVKMLIGKKNKLKVMLWESY